MARAIYDADRAHANQPGAGGAAGSGRSHRRELCGPSRAKEGGDDSPWVSLHAALIAAADGEASQVLYLRKMAQEEE